MIALVSCTSPPPNPPATSDIIATVSAAVAATATAQPTATPGYALTPDEAIAVVKQYLDLKTYSTSVQRPGEGFILETHRCGVYTAAKWTAQYSNGFWLVASLLAQQRRPENVNVSQYRVNERTLTVEALQTLLVVLGEVKPFRSCPDAKRGERWSIVTRLLPVPLPSTARGESCPASTASSRSVGAVGRRRSQLL